MNLDLAYKHLDKYLDRIIASNDVTDSFHICIELRRFLLGDVIFSEIVERRSGLYNQAMQLFSTDVILLFKEIRTFSSEIERHCLKSSTNQKKLQQLTFTPEFDFRAANIDHLHYYTYGAIKNLFSSAHALRLRRRIRGFKDNRFELAEDAQSFIAPLLKLFFDFFEKLHAFALVLRKDSPELAHDWIEDVSKPCIKRLRSLAESFNYVTYYNHTKDWIEFLLLSYEEIIGTHNRTNRIHTLLARSRATNETIKSTISRIIFDCQEEIVTYNPIELKAPRQIGGNHFSEQDNLVLHELQTYAQKQKGKVLSRSEQMYVTKFDKKTVSFVLAVTGREPIIGTNNKMTREKEAIFITQCHIDSKPVFESKAEVNNNYLRLLCAALLISVPEIQGDGYIDKKRIKELVPDITSPDQIRGHARGLLTHLTHFGVSQPVVIRNESHKGRWIRSFPISKPVKCN